MKKLTLLGVQLETEAYPNVIYRVQALRNNRQLEVNSIHVPGWSQATQSVSGKSRIFRNFWRMLCAHIKVIWRYRMTAPASNGTTYIPYPAVGLMWLLSFIPGKPDRVVADVFISLYDTAIIDRGLYRPGSVTARLLYALERRALKYADAVIVDTAENADYLGALFKLPREKFIPIPLSTDESHFFSREYTPAGPDCKVLFIGTLIPLHGIETIVAAAGLLSDRPDIKVKIIGDGQERNFITGADADSNGNIQWDRGWKSSEQLAREIEQADLCLGIFGNTAKAARVLPFKIYAYAGVGRPIITAATECSRRLEQLQGRAPWLVVPPGDAQALANAIRTLADDSGLRSTLADAAATLYRSHLSNDAAHEALLQALFPADT